ncbi:MAG TPA: FkbM family methyltransferase [Pirellulales bacterium]|nr:FkbM family methyltransferase [Pirellulales bacterium]
MSEDTVLRIEETLKAFPQYRGLPEPDYVIDFLGTRTRAEYVRGLQGGTVEGYPLPVNFHATALEWAGALAAVHEAADELCVVELGAGWAPWLVATARAARLRGINHVRLTGVEGSKKHCEYMSRHFRDNGLDPAAHTLLHGVVGPRDGTAEFPVLADPSLDWGTPAIFAAPDGGLARRLRRCAATLGRRVGTRAATERLPCYSIGTLLKPFRVVDLLHVDIQGHEHVVLAAARQVLRQKVKRTVVGTHGRAIEQQLLDMMSADGWLLEAEETCLYRQSNGGVQLVRDGCQVWKNPAWIGPSPVRSLSQAA